MLMLTGYTKKPAPGLRCSIASREKVKVFRSRMNKNNHLKETRNVKFQQKAKGKSKKRLIPGVYQDFSTSLHFAGGNEKRAKAKPGNPNFRHSKL
jgi:hypothetical protein